MVQGHVPPPDQGLRRIERYIQSGRAPEGTMLVSDMDGFLTALTLCPEDVPQDEWMSVIWDGEEPEFRNRGEREEILGAIVSRRDEIATKLSDGTGSFSPLFERSAETGEIIVTYWAGGFLSAVLMRQDAWARYMGDENTRAALHAMTLIGSQGRRTESVDIEPGVMDELLRDGPSTIAECVFTLHYFKRHGHVPSAPPKRMKRIPADTRRRRR